MSQKEICTDVSLTGIPCQYKHNVIRDRSVGHNKMPAIDGLYKRDIYVYEEKCIDIIKFNKIPKNDRVMV